MLRYSLEWMVSRINVCCRRAGSYWIAQKKVFAVQLLFEHRLLCVLTSLFYPPPPPIVLSSLGFVWRSVARSLDALADNRYCWLSGFVQMCSLFSGERAQQLQGAAFFAWMAGFDGSGFFCG